MPKQHIYLDFDIQDRSGSWVRSFNFENIQFHTKASRPYDSMMARCSDVGSYKKQFATYNTASTEFESFQHFAGWCQTQNGYFGHDGSKSWCLDKDVLVHGNKTYSPETCVFIPEFINTLFVNKKVTSLPFGVTKHLNKYRARCSTTFGRINLGCFYTPEEAHKAWQKAKAEHILTVSEVYLKLPESDIHVYTALVSRHNLLMTDILSGKETLII